MASSANHTFTFDQGATWRKKVTWREPSTNPNDPLAGDPIDISGYTSRFSVLDPDRTIEIVEVIPTLGGALGTIEWVLSSAQTDALTKSKYRYELALTDGASEVIVLLKGQINVKLKVDA